MLANVPDRIGRIGIFFSLFGLKLYFDQEHKTLYQKPSLDMIFLTSFSSKLHSHMNSMKVTVFIIVDQGSNNMPFSMASIHSRIC